MEYLKNNIRELQGKKLPGEPSHRKMLPPERDLHIPAHLNGSVKPSGVLLPLFPDGDELFACLIKRSATMKIHAGQIGFPGGKQDGIDQSPKETALRETTEEIGLSPDEIDVIAELTPLYVSVSNFIIYPYVGWLEKKPTFRINHHEVEKILFFPIFAHLKNPVVQNKYIQTVSGKLKVPGIPFEGEFIWGATAMILMEFLDILSSVSLTRE